MVPNFFLHDKYLTKPVPGEHTKFTQKGPTPILHLAITVNSQKANTPKILKLKAHLFHRSLGEALG